MTSIGQAVIAKLEELPPEKQQEVLDFVDFLRQRSTRDQPSRDWYGILAHLNIDISEEDIAEARREMWGNFPRKIDL